MNATASVTEASGTRAPGTKGLVTVLAFTAALDAPMIWLAFTYLAKSLISGYLKRTTKSVDTQ